MKFSPRGVLAILGIAALSAVSSPLRAQGADVIRGRVTDEQNAPIANVQVSATSFSGNVTRHAVTDRDGRFTITFPNGDGDYMVAFNAPGFGLKRFEVKRTADQDILVADTRLSHSTATLDTVRVNSRTRPNRYDKQPDIGGTQQLVNSQALTADQRGDLAAMAASVPGTLYLPGANGDPSGFSVLGLDGSQNANTLNGMDFGGSNIPRDAAVQSSLNTAPYDVSLGGFSGGQFNIQTSSGTNFLRRTMSAVVDAPSLQWTDAAARALGQQYTNLNVSGGLSGPIQYDKSFYNLSYQLGQRANPWKSLLNTSALGLETAGIAPDSVTRLLGIMQQDDIPCKTGGMPGQQLNDQGVVLGSFDFAPPSSTSGQAVNVTASGTWFKFNPLSASTSELPAHSGAMTSWMGGIQAHHSAYFGFGVLTETGLSVSAAHRYGTPFLDLPSASVRVSSDFADGTSGVQNVSLGGSPFLNTSNSMHSVGLKNQLSWFTLDNKHRLKLTTEMRRDSYALDQTTNQLGSFSFNSLDDFQAGRPASFTRTLLPRDRGGSEWVGALSLGDSYRYSDDLQVQYGVRLDGDRYADAPTENPLVAQTFGVRNDHVPDRVYASPRVGFSWSYGVAPDIGAFAGAVRGPRAVVRGGIGLFQNVNRVTDIGAAADNTGLATGLQQITCVGTAAPVPDWSAYAGDPAAIPASCADGSTGGAFSNSAPNVTMYAPDYNATRSLRSNLQWSGPILGNRFNATFNGMYSLNLNQPSQLDVNFVPNVAFTLPDEANRPVFVPSGSIVPGTGVVSSNAAHASNQFNRVTELRSDMQSRSAQLAAQLAPASYNSHYTWSLAYTFQDIRERTRGFGGGNTAGNPLAVAWSRANFDARHQIQYSLGYNFFDWVRVNWYGRLQSGMPFTPIVASDINGDGYANDRAFVFDPAHTSDPRLATAMQSLLAASSDRVRNCLERQLGAVAGRNSCEGPWTSTASMSISFNPIKVHMPQRATLSFQLANPLGAADLLLHGENRAHGWGQSAFPDPSLLYVSGFDPQTHRYTYQVNSRFGSTRPQVTATRSPITLTAMLQVDVGPTRERQLLTQALDEGRTHQGFKLTAPILRALYGSGGVMNPMAAIMRQMDTLQLTPAQADSIATLNRWYTLRLDSIWTPITTYFANLPDHYDEGVAYDRYQRGREATVDMLLELSPRIRGLLTDAQRRMLPDFVSSYLDPRYLAAIRSGTGGLINSGFGPGGAGGMGGPVMLGGGAGQIVIRK
ncbi:MAG TPA: carboxypeptidase-like regulatory domain-containing protein [Gemmatimonadaceae bacterium]|nr:carboxypeptidase-like regulatory domain-containing protein [Gemmatimonadaceae bacterium]